MKRFGVMFTLVIMISLLFAGANFRSDNNESNTPDRKGCGYTLIEAGKAIDCKGDTIAVKRIHPEIAQLN